MVYDCQHEVDMGQELCYYENIFGKDGFTK